MSGKEGNRQWAMGTRSWVKGVTVTILFVMGLPTCHGEPVEPCQEQLVAILRQAQGDIFHFSLITFHFPLLYYP